ncbi:hypothetical protein ACCD03_03385 [Ralstonia sp. Ralssp135]
MEATRTGFYVALMLVRLAKLVLETTASPVLVEAFVAHHYLLSLLFLLRHRLLHLFVWCVDGGTVAK